MARDGGGKEQTDARGFVSRNGQELIRDRGHVIYAKTRLWRNVHPDAASAHVDFPLPSNSPRSPFQQGTRNPTIQKPFNSRNHTGVSENSKL